MLGCQSILIAYTSNVNWQKTAIILGASLTLAGCGPKTDNNLGAIKLDQAQVIPSDSTQDINQAPTERQTPMKTLADFEKIEGTKAILITDKGEIELELYRDLAPLTTLNFLTLAKSGFYDGVSFHRVVPGFVIQGGDPLSKDPTTASRAGTGGPGYVIEDEFGQGLSHDSAGILSMANAGPDTGGSQFFITLGPATHLDGKHAIFGKVIAGMDVVNQIAVGDKINQVVIE